MTLKRVLMALLTVGVIGWAIFGAWIWRASEVQKTTEASARREFAAVRARLGGNPWLTRGADGRFVRNAATRPATSAAPPSRLHVLVWRADPRRLTTTALPLWFLRLKDIPVRLILKRAGVDLDALDLRPRDLQRHDAGVVCDELFANGDRLLIWTE